MLPTDYYISYFPTGSKYICNPPVITTDEDWMYLVNDLDDTHLYLSSEGWVVSGVSYNTIENMWASYRKGVINLLVTNSQDHYNKFEAATELAKKRNLLNKEDRVALFRSVVGAMVQK